MRDPYYHGGGAGHCSASTAETFQLVADRDRERRAFIRDHASRLDVAYNSWSPEQCWKHAREMWYAKPEDC